MRYPSKILSDGRRVAIHDLTYGRARVQVFENAEEVWATNVW